jgi:putative flavoprotein involved in K+ transport
MFTRTAQPGLWFIAGSFAQCRIYSKYLALQIKAFEEGLLPDARAVRESPKVRSAATGELTSAHAQGS